jgi:long-subunit fatty acid transport protein
VQSTLTTTAQQLTATAGDLAAADPNDTTAQATATGTLIARTDQARQLIQSIADIDLSDAQRATIGQLPSCRGVIG